MVAALHSSVVPGSVPAFPFALRLLFTQTDGSVFALGAVSPSNWLSLVPQVAEEAVQICVCEGLVSFSVWAHVYLTQLAAWGCLRSVRGWVVLC